MNDSQIQARAYSYFLAEAPELMQTIEQEILTLPSEHTTAKVHNLMRALHTLKGAAANVGLDALECIAHSFEDMTRVFYDLDVNIDPSIQTLLLDGYSGLQECLDAQINNLEIDEGSIVERMSVTLECLKSKLGDWSEADIGLPTAIELGFDIVASIFETTIQEQIDEVVTAIATQDASLILACLDRVTDTCISLAESFELPGFLALNQAILAAISHHPDRIKEIALLALVDLQQAQTDVLAGDRTNGGSVSVDLAQLAAPAEAVNVPQLEAHPTVAIDLPQIEPLGYPLGTRIASHDTELAAFQAFLISDRFRKRHEFSADNQHLFTQIIKLCWDWFRHEIQPHPDRLNLELLIMTEGLADLDYIHHWIGLLLKGLNTPSFDMSISETRSSLHLYQQCCVYQVVFAVAKYLADTETHLQLTPEFLTELRLELQATVNTYKQGSSVTANERGWIDRIILPHNWATNYSINTSEDLLLSEIWGQTDFGNDLQ
ncbi:Hpt domain-containing protein [Chamaesiphon sp. GL140_3_metabinner_50]|uniref:Hpt domain-containing protein n=1 Tax=Chamaesiphon sp. GL140_3_metabinner_50 TaxID=2970812 RepID=UPI0025FC3AAA|nr:Hpt domain-containing protein [Chamaesiphon sp. GL140_3_metabinner_50]